MSDHGGDVVARELETSEGINIATSERRGIPMPDDESVHNSATELLSSPDDLRRRWAAIQAEFVDDPRQAVGDAEHLVSSVMDDLIAGFRRQREELDEQWTDGMNTSTDELRSAIQRYRDFFDRMLRV